MPRQQTHSDDDGRTIADMSGVGGYEPPAPLSRASRDVREELGDPEDQRMVIFGALKAGISLWAVYVVVFGIVITLMLLFWT